MKILNFFKKLLIQWQLNCHRKKWSKIYWDSKGAVYKYPLLDCHKITYSSPDELSQKVKALANEMRITFKYTSDNLWQLYDSMRPPADCYKQVVENGKLYDDCDGFHALMYHILTQNNIDCVLCTAVPLKNTLKTAHTFLTYRENSHWRILDYWTIETDSYKNPRQATLEHYKRFGDMVISLDVWDENQFIKYKEN